MARWSFMAMWLAAGSLWAEGLAQAGADGGLVETPDAGVAHAEPAKPEPAPPVAPVAAPPPVAAPTPTPSEPSEPWFDFSTLLPVTPALSSLHYDLSAVYQHQGFGFAEGPMTLTGLRFVERNSGLGKMTVYVVSQLLMGLAESAAASGLVQHHLGTEYGPGYRIDYYQRYSESEVNEMRRSRERAGESMLQSNMSLDLQLYLPMQGRSTASGLSVELTPLTLEFTDSGEVGLEVAFAYTKLTDVIAGDSRLRSYESLGAPIRLMANWRFVQVQLQWVMNFFGGFGFNQAAVEKNYLTSLEASSGTRAIMYNNSPLSLSVSLHPLRWVFVRATGMWNRYQFNADSLGFQLEAGVRL